MGVKSYANWEEKGLGAADWELYFYYASWSPDRYYVHYVFGCLGIIKWKL